MEDDAVEGEGDVPKVYLAGLEAHYLEEASVHQDALIEGLVVGLLDYKYLVLELLALKEGVHVREEVVEVVDAILVRYDYGDTVARAAVDWRPATFLNYC